MRYQLEQRIHILAENVVDSRTDGAPQFTVDGVTLTSWRVDPSDGYWTHHYWLASGEINALDFNNAWQLFWNKLARIIPRISLVSQCYAEYLTQPILILRQDSDIAFLRYTVEQPGVGLMFMDQEQKAFNFLLADSQIPNAFFWYWHDATNSTGYASRLLLMLSAVEALVTTRSDGRKPQKDYAKLELILGQELKRDLWGTQEDHGNALRHRLIHGEYFKPEDGQKDYLLILHQKVIKYFNEVIFKENIIDENVLNPQRHPFGNRLLGQSFLRAEENATLTLVRVIADMDSNHNFAHYERVVDEQLWSNY